MRRGIVTLAMAAGLAAPAAGAVERYACLFEAACAAAPCPGGALTVAFEIDPGQFLTALYPDDPPRVKRTTVTAGDRVFVAEPFLIGATRGFWAETGAPGQVMLTTGPEGRARYTDTAAGQSWPGRCEETG